MSPITPSRSWCGLLNCDESTISKNMAKDYFITPPHLSDVISKCSNFLRKFIRIFTKYIIFRFVAFDLCSNIGGSIVLKGNVLLSLRILTGIPLSLWKAYIIYILKFRQMSFCFEGTLGSKYLSTVIFNFDIFCKVLFPILLLPVPKNIHFLSLLFPPPSLSYNLQRKIDTVLFLWTYCSPLTRSVGVGWKSK